MKREIELVGHWHDTFAVPRRELGDTAFHEVTHGEWVLRKNLITEEGGELVDALVKAEGIIQVAKEVADLAYVVAGTSVQTGLAATDENEADGAIGMLLKGIVDGLTGELNALAFVRDPNTRGELAAIVRKRMAQLEVILLGICSLKGIPYDDVFDEVHRSNMSKANPDGTVTRREDGKVMKPATYSPANLSFLLDDGDGTDA